jgi:hypothetical protein
MGEFCARCPFGEFCRRTSQMYRCRTESQTACLRARRSPPSWLISPAGIQHPRPTTSSPVWSTLHPLLAPRQLYLTATVSSGHHHWSSTPARARPLSCPFRGPPLPRMIWAALLGWYGRVGRGQAGVPDKAQRARQVTEKQVAGRVIREVIKRMTGAAGPGRGISQIAGPPERLDIKAIVKHARSSITRVSAGIPSSPARSSEQPIHEQPEPSPMDPTTQSDADGMRSEAAADIVDVWTKLGFASPLAVADRLPTRSTLHLEIDDHELGPMPHRRHKTFRSPPRTSLSPDATTSSASVQSWQATYVPPSSARPLAVNRETDRAAERCALSTPTSQFKVRLKIPKELQDLKRAVEGSGGEGHEEGDQGRRLRPRRPIMISTQT